MMKSGDSSFAFRFCSLLTVLSASAASNGAKNVEDSRHSLILSDDTHRFTESLVIVGTLDGKLRGLDPVRNGMIRWNAALSDEPLLSSSLSSVQMMKEFIGFRLIPSLDGGLYQFSWDSIEAMPLNADMLLSSSFKLNDGIGLVGGKNVQQMGIDPGTGKRIYSCSDDGCDSGGSDSLRDILVIKRTQKTVRAVNERTGSERWNFSVGQHKLSLLSTHSDGKHHRLPDEDLNVKQSIQVSIPEGIVAVVHSSGSEIFSKKILWKQQFDTPVAAVWVLNNGVLEEVDLLKATVPPKSLNGDNDMPLMYYIGFHEDQLYIHPSDKMEDAVRIAIEKVMSGSTSQDQAVVANSKRRIIWKPYLATSASRTPAIVGKTELAVRQPLDYPFDNGHYFYGPMPTSEGYECLNNNTNSDGNGDTGQEFLMKLKKCISKWWSELLILVFTIGFFARQIFKYWRKHSAIKNGLTVNLPCGDLEVEVRRKSEDNKYVHSPISVQSPDNFQSRYQLDFEHETCLGSGAYGLVFQARNKLDDCQYAVKRIRLPNNQKARNKVMREVKVLATLEHPGIVRYYNSWCEEPPVEWLREWDDKLRGDSKCPTINTMPSYTSPSSDEDIQSQEMSLNDKLSDYERSVDFSMSRGSRKRHDTITVENEDMVNELERTSGHCEGVDSDNSGSFDVQFEPRKADHSVANNNGKKINDDSSGVVFQNSSAAQDNNFISSSSEIEQSNMEAQSSEKRRFPSHLLYIQMQLCRKDSLKDWLSANTMGRNLSHSIDIFRQLVVAVDYIHQKGHIHRDLKPSNILFALDGMVKVGDFGLVAACQPSLEEDGELESIHSTNQSLTGQVGTQLYASPEQEAGTNYCFRADIFSLGIIFFELFHVFHTQMERLKTLTAVRVRNIPETFTEDMPLQSELALWLLAKNPSDRPSAEAISKSLVFSELLDKLTPPQSATTSATTESDNQ